MSGNAWIKGVQTHSLNGIDPELLVIILIPFSLQDKVWLEEDFGLPEKFSLLTSAETSAFRRVPNRNV